MDWFISSFCFILAVTTFENQIESIGTELYLFFKGASTDEMNKDSFVNESFHARSNSISFSSEMVSSSDKYSFFLNGLFNPSDSLDFSLLEELEERTLVGTAILSSLTLWSSHTDLSLRGCEGSSSNKLRGLYGNVHPGWSLTGWTILGSVLVKEMSSCSSLLARGFTVLRDP